VHPLDNPVWHALTGPQATVAEGSAQALRYDPAIGPFAALPDDPTPASWDALRELVGDAPMAFLARAELVVPDGWDAVFRGSGVQMVAESVSGEPTTDAVELGADDVPDMMRLVDATRPGPFYARTIELGRYIGIRSATDGALIAMGGVRMQLPDYIELSAICTDAAHRGQGLATKIVRDLVAAAMAHCETPVLHAVAENTTAIKLYERLGFTGRRTLDFAAIRPSPSM
jgi:ribosomal protein S18 acetylase RimI-like enzyme